MKTCLKNPTNQVPNLL